MNIPKKKKKLQPNKCSQSAACTALQNSGDVEGRFYKNNTLGTSFQEWIIRSMYLEMLEIKLIKEEDTQYILLYPLI